MILKKKDFIEIEFTGKVKDGEIFDSNIKEDLKNANLDFEPKPFVFCLGEKMFLEGVEDFLIGKEIGEYEIELTPEKAFGNRDSTLVKILSMKVFKENKLNPSPGMMFNFDGKIAKILSVSGGRITVDFNNPLSGKIVVYKIKILRKISHINEKAKALIEFFFKRSLKFEIKDKKIIIEAEKELVKFVEIFKDKFKEVLELDLEVKEISEKLKEEGKKGNSDK
tara:strand:- start:4365 stop:5033 length:669 start_codon:yes stop_codon:yes gene_type:complete